LTWVYQRAGGLASHLAHIFLTNGSFLLDWMADFNRRERHHALSL